MADPADGTPLDRALVLWFEGPHSVTGEDVAEFHLHGGRAVVEGVLGALGGVPGLRPAEAGEFTRRAFERGKLDLTEVEGLADLIDAETAGQRRQALRQMSGALGRLYEGWRQSLIGALAHAEAEIDFPDEDLPAALSRKIAPAVDRLTEEIAAHLADGGRGERLRDGVEVVILGPPNVGKSSLLNRLAGRDAAIVSEEAGTTRDVVEVRLDLAGIPVTLADTAGLREAASAIEQEGVRRALARAENADLRLWIAATDRDGGLAGGFGQAGPDDVRVVNKIDLAQGSAATYETAGAFAISADRGDGIDRLVEALTTRVSASYGVTEAPAVTRARHRVGLEEAVRHLKRAAEALRIGGETELLAEDLRLAARALGRITGRIDVEDLLDVIFRDFCIGK